MEEFSLEKYKTGEYDVITRDGKNVRIICTDKKGDIYSIVGLIEEGKDEYINTFTEDGLLSIHSKDSGSNLFLVKKRWKPKEGDCYYIVSSTLGVLMQENYQEDIYQDKLFYKVGNCFKTKEEAEEMAKKIRQLVNDEK